MLKYLIGAVLVTALALVPTPLAAATRVPHGLDNPYIDLLALGIVVSATFFFMFKPRRPL